MHVIIVDMITISIETWNSRRMVKSGMDNGTPASIVRVTTVFLNANNINVTDVPSKSPDLNLIENILDELNHRVRRTVEVRQTITQLRAKIVVV